MLWLFFVWCIAFPVAAFLMSELLYWVVEEFWAAQPLFVVDGVLSLESPHEFVMVHRVFKPIEAFEYLSSRYEDVTLVYVRGKRNQRRVQKIWEMAYGS